MKQSKKLTMIVFVIYLSIFFSACSKKKSQKSENTSPIKIATILGLSGPNAAYGEKMKRGFDLAIEEVNQLGGVNGRKVELVAEDSKFDPTFAVTAYSRLHDVRKIGIFVGITGSKIALPVCAAAKRDDVVIIDALGSAPKLTEEGGVNYFRVMASDALAGQYNVDWAISMGMKTPVVVYSEDDWGASYRKSILAYLNKMRFSNISVHAITQGLLDFRVQVEKLKSASIDTIFLLLYPKEAASFMQQLREAGIKARIMGSDNLSSPEFIAAGNAVVEGVFVALPSPSSGPIFEEFTKKYRAAFNEDPDSAVIKSYDAMMVAIKAIGQVGEKPDRIRELLHSPQLDRKSVV
jgi:branched-chain amino acid transport system substrate-binding protein